MSAAAEAAFEAVFVNLETHGLPVEYVGIPGFVGSLCPLCRAGMRVELTDHAVTFVCLAGCAEADIAEALNGRPL
jgi:hypothetical protein